MSEKISNSKKLKNALEESRTIFTKVITDELLKNNITQSLTSIQSKLRGVISVLTQLKQIDKLITDTDEKDIKGEGFDPLLMLMAMGSDKKPFQDHILMAMYKMLEKMYKEKEE